MFKIVFTLMLGALMVGCANGPKVTPLPDMSEKEYSEKFQRDILLAEKGSANAASAVAWMYIEGKGVAQDKEKALYWYKKANEFNPKWVPTYLQLSKMYRRGIGTYPSALKGCEYDREANALDQRVDYNTAFCNWRLNGAVAIPRFEEKVKYDHIDNQAWGASNLYSYYAYGVGTPVDMGKACEYMKLANRLRPSEYPVTRECQ